MPAYVVAWVKVEDPEAMNRYGAEVVAVIERFGGRYLFSGPGAEGLQGDWQGTGMAIIEFPSHEDARCWYDSPECAPVRAPRQAAGPTSLIMTPDAPTG